MKTLAEHAVMYGVRTAREEDIGLIRDHLLAFVAECGLFGYDEDTARHLVMDSIVNRMAFMVMANDVPIGSCGMERRKVWGSNDGGHFTNTWIYIDPHARSLRAAFALVDLMYEVAKHNKQRFYLSVFTTDGERKSSLYARMMDDICQYYELRSAGGEFQPKDQRR